MPTRNPAKGGHCGPTCKVRYVMAILSSLGLFLIYGLKVGLHVVIVAMVNHTAIDLEGGNDSVTNNSSDCGFDTAQNETSTEVDGPFTWNKEIQGWILASYFFGYLVSELPGGRIAELYSAKWVFFFAVAINVVAVLLSPVISKLHYGGLLVLRILQGIGGGVTFPCSHVLLSNWAPPLERSVMSSIVYAGTSLGTVVFMLVSGIIANSISWEAVFYIEGGFAIIWLIIWTIFVEDRPVDQHYITMEERTMIMEALAAEHGGHHEEPPPMPWKHIFESPAFLAILVAHTCSNWGWYMVLIELPSYMSDVLEFNLKENAVLTAVPFLTNWIFTMILSKILDVLRAKGKISTTWARKVATLFASLVPLICFIFLCIIECNRGLAVALMTIAITSIGGMFCGFLSNHIDISPNYAGTLMGITNTVATIPGIVVPIVVGLLTHTDPSIHSWRIVFYITIILYLIEIVVYTIFGSGDVQKWNAPDLLE